MHVKEKKFLWAHAREFAIVLGRALLACALVAPIAWAQQSSKSFDHLTTGFALTGQHRIARCEDCHVRGIFKGTPAQCAACHTPGTLVTAVIIANNHIPVSQPCDSCHTTATFYGAHFPHSDVASGTCASCHNGVFAPGKNPGHIGTNASCDVCHTTLSFANAYLAQPVGHIPTQQPCSSCHSSSTFVPGVMNHANTGGTCNQCHAASTTPYTFTIPGTITINGQVVTLTANPPGQPVTVIPTSQGGLNATNTGAPVNHIPTSASCDRCHTNSVFTAGGFKGGVMHHAAVTGQSCSNCHSNPTTFAGTGLGAGGEPFQIPGPVGTPGLSDHIPINGLDCGNSGCHVASDTPTATGTGFATHLTPALSAAGHAAVNLACETCHAVGMTWKLDSTSMVTPSSAHVPPDNAGAAVACSSCHLATSVGSGGFHLGGTPGTSPVMTVAMHTAVASAVPACASCHEAGSLNFQGVLGQIYLRPNNGANSGLSQGTDSAHTGTAATADCGGCHSTTPPFSNANARPAGHIPIVSSATCATCHTTGVFNTVVLPMPHAGVVSGSCGSCHGSGLSGSGYLGPFAGPSVLGGSYTPGNVLFVPKQIISSPAIGTAGGHILPPPADDCNVCHLLTSAFGPGTVMVHTNISSGCAACHSNGASWYGVSSTATMLVTTGGKVLSPPHVPTAGATNAACEMCHSTSVFTSFSGTTVSHTSGRFMTFTAHTSATPACKSCHGPRGATWYGVTLTTATVGSHQGSAANQDCINCHSTNGFSGGPAAPAVARRPVVHAANGPALRPGVVSIPAAAPGSPAASSPTLFTHVGVQPGACGACHRAGAAAARPASHLLTNLSCDACHRTTSWLPALFAHSGVAMGSCAGCHGGSWASAKPVGHMLTNRACDSCHRSTTSWVPRNYEHLDTVYTPHPVSVPCVACHSTNTEAVLWKYPNFKPVCAGCHGAQWSASPEAHRARGPAAATPRQLR